MSWYWIVAILYTILNIVKGIKDKSKDDKTIDPCSFAVIVAISLFLTPVALCIDICEEIHK